MISVVGFALAVWLSDVYRLIPGWGPIRRYDHEGSEDLRTRQMLIHEHATRWQEEPPADHTVKRYGTIGQPTWGTCEGPDKRETPIYHPVYGVCKLREGFAETQRLRAECPWWAKDEPSHIAEAGYRAPSLRINELPTNIPHRMV